MNSSRRRDSSSVAPVDEPRMRNAVACDATALALLPHRGDEECFEVLDRSDELEEIDTEDDDAEFDERAHWGRRRANEKKSKKQVGSDKNQPKINIFCVVTAEIPAEQDSLPTHTPTSKNAQGSDGDRVGTDTLLRDQPVAQRCFTSTSQSLQEEVTDFPVGEGAETSSSSPEHTTQSGRPKRRAVLKSEQAKLSANVDVTLVALPVVHTAEVGIRATNGRKRKLDVNGDKKKTPQSPGPIHVKGAAANKNPVNTFFMTEEEKKQVLQIEAVASLKEHLREQREKDIAFFGNRDANNPFFQARGFSSSQRTIGDDTKEVIEVLDSPESSPAKQRKPRWSKESASYPSQQHTVKVLEGGYDVSSTRHPGVLPRKVNTIQTEQVNHIIVLDDDEKILTTKSVSPDLADAQVPFDDQFWLLAAPMHCAGDILHPDFSADLSTEEFVDRISGQFGLKEKRVRKILSALELARTKRQDKSLNLSLVDRYLPVRTSGMIGNKSALKKLSIWLTAWKSGGMDRSRSCDDSLLAFEDDDSDDDDGTQLCRLFILKGDIGSGKSAAVYACADELGYEIIEINAGQLRTGKAIVDIAGEATQSNRVLHSGGHLGDKQKKSKKVKKRRTVLNNNKPSHLSLVLFEDVDLIFEDDKGFLSTLSSIAKHSKCPIVVTCRQLPDGFPSSPPAISERLVRPSKSEFMVWLLLVAFLERIQLSQPLSQRLADLFDCDIRRTLNFLQAYRHRIDFSQQHTSRTLAWRPAEELASIGAGRDAWAPIELIGSQDDIPPTFQPVPAWSLSTTRSFDLLTSNFLPSLQGSACDSRLQLSDDHLASRCKRERLASCMDDVWDVLESVSFADEFKSRSCEHAIEFELEEEGAAHFESERARMLSLDIRMTALSNFTDRRKREKEMLSLRNCRISDGVGQALEAALQARLRSKTHSRMMELKRKLELPLVVKGSELVGAHFSTDYIPLLARVSEHCEPFQESRRRSSRRNHYLREIVGDMSTVDDLRGIQLCYPHIGAVDDEVMPLSASSSFNLSEDTSICI